MPPPMPPWCQLSRHEKWMAEHGRTYREEEEARRMEIFRANAKLFDSFNAAGEGGHRLATNKFADLTDEEFRAVTTGYQRPPAAAGAGRGSGWFRYENFSLAAAPQSLDWRTMGAVTGVKDQGSCEVRGQHARRLLLGVLGGGGGGGADQDPDGAAGVVVGAGAGGLRRLRRGRGLRGRPHGHRLPVHRAPRRPRRGVVLPVPRHGRVVPVVGLGRLIRGHEDVPRNNEGTLMAAVAHQPVSVAINGGDFVFRFYDRGVLGGSGCGTDLDHAITAVGYGTASDGTKYWLMKNSWGSSWGEGGYVRIRRGVSGEGVCGLAKIPSYPV